MLSRTIYIEPATPPKPAWGQPCNGCGICCLTEPCPLGSLLSRRRRGACMALRWERASGLYRCSVLLAPAEVLQEAAWPGRWGRGLRPLLAPAAPSGGPLDRRRPQLRLQPGGRAGRAI